MSLNELAEGLQQTIETVRWMKWVVGFIGVMHLLAIIGVLVLCRTAKLEEDGEN